MHTSRSRHRNHLEAIAHERRRHPTFTEAKLWQRLKGSQLGVGFRREFVIGRYIVDLCAPSRRLVVEIDGSYHALVQSRDARRDRALARAGWRVLRVDAELVSRDVDAAVALVREGLGVM